MNRSDGISVTREKSWISVSLKSSIKKEERQFYHDIFREHWYFENLEFTLVSFGSDIPSANQIYHFDNYQCENVTMYLSIITSLKVTFFFHKVPYETAI